MPVWDVSNAIYENKSLDISAKEPDVDAVCLSSDGTNLYILGEKSIVYQYSLSTAHDISTAIYSGLKSVFLQSRYPHCLRFSSDGSRMYVGDDDDENIYQYSLSSEWDVTSASYAGDYLNVSDELSRVKGMAFSSDGTALYLAEDSAERIYQYTLSTPWLVATGSYSAKQKWIGDDTLHVTEVEMSSDGLTMFISGDGETYQYGLSIAWNVASAFYSGIYHDASGEGGDHTGLAFSQDGKAMYTSSTTNDAIYQYILDYLDVDGTSLDLALQATLGNVDVQADINVPGVFVPLALEATTSVIITDVDVDINGASRDLALEVTAGTVEILSSDIDIPGISLDLALHAPRSLVVVNVDIEIAGSSVDLALEATQGRADIGVNIAGVSRDLALDAAQGTIISDIDVDIASSSLGLALEATQGTAGLSITIEGNALDLAIEATKSQVSAPRVSGTRNYLVPFRDRTYEVPLRDRSYVVPFRDRTYIV